MSDLRVGSSGRRAGRTDSRVDDDQVCDRESETEDAGKRRRCREAALDRRQGGGKRAHRYVKAICQEFTAIGLRFRIKK